MTRTRGATITGKTTMMRPRSRLEWVAVIAAFVGTFALGFLTGMWAGLPLFTGSQKGAQKLEQRAIAAEQAAKQRAEPSDSIR
jgi:hypothetical protein